MSTFGNNLATTSDELSEYLIEKKKQKIRDFRRNSLIDMHTHTFYSDGELSPNELLKLAIEKHIGIIAITDHDTIEGLKNIIYGTRETELVKIIPGIELSAKSKKGRLHILGYGINIKNKQLNEMMSTLKNNSINSVLSIIEQIKRDYGIIFTYDELRDLINSNHNLGRPDIAKLCVKKEYAKTIQEAFDKYLIDSYNKVKSTNNKLTYEECIKLIIDSGGIPVLAHPKTLELSNKELIKLLIEMKEIGLQGIEAYYSEHSEEETQRFLSLASELDLLISGGTDFHGVGIKPHIELGTGINNNLKIKKLSLINRIK